MNNAIEKNNKKEASKDFQDTSDKSGIRTKLIDLEKSECGIETAMPLNKDENVDSISGGSETQAMPESLLVDHVSDIEVARPQPLLEMNVEDGNSGAESRESNSNPSASVQGPVASPVARIDSSDDDYPIADPSIDDMANAIFSPPAPLESRQEPAATLVDQEEEARKMQEQIDKEVEKKLAQERDNAEVADIVPRFWCTPRAKRCIALGVVLAIVAVVLGIVLSRVLVPPTPTLPPTAAPTSPLPGLMELLSSISFDGGAALETPGTPQNEAVIWLANNTNLGDYSDDKKIQRYVLVTLYYSTNGNLWRYNDWLSDGDECSWYNSAWGVSFCVNGAVVELGLSINNLNGTIPVELALLSSSVKKVNFESNALTGKIPTEIGLLTKLTQLDLDQNALTGMIPSEIALMTNLSSLQLYNNALTGMIPSEIALLTKLTGLELNNNGLTGMIPTEIGQLTELSDSLLLYNNKLMGSIPTEIALMTNLNYLYLYNNSLTGLIPTEIALLTNLIRLDLYNNTFSGNFTCPDFVRICHISCFDLGSHNLNSTCRTL